MSLGPAVTPGVIMNGVLVQGHDSDLPCVPDLPPLQQLIINFVFMFLRK